MRSLFAAIIGVFAVFVVARRRPMCLRAGARLAKRLSNVATSLQSRGTRGALVSRIDPGSPAEKAGLEIGDVIIRFAGNRVKNSAQLRQVVAEARPGAGAVVEVLRNGRRQSFSVTIGESVPGSATTDKS
jgi:serine protease Do